MQFKNVLFIAPPAAGKGTIAKILSDKYNIPHISIGALLRDAVDDTERGGYIADMQSKGILVSDDITLELIKERIQKDDCNNGYILDGFPRNVNQAILYDKMLNELRINIGCVIYFNIDKEIAKSRIIGRLSCPSCGSVYNELIDGRKPKISGKCDICEKDLVKRSDDNELAYETRYQVYVNETMPLIDYYKNRNLLYTIDSSISLENTFKQIEDIMRGNI